MAGLFQFRRSREFRRTGCNALFQTAQFTESRGRFVLQSKDGRRTVVGKLQSKGRDGGQDGNLIVLVSLLLVRVVLLCCVGPGEIRWTQLSIRLNVPGRCNSLLSSRSPVEADRRVDRVNKGSGVVLLWCIEGRKTPRRLVVWNVKRVGGRARISLVVPRLVFSRWRGGRGPEGARSGLGTARIDKHGGQGSHRLFRCRAGGRGPTFQGKGGQRDGVQGFSLEGGAWYVPLRLAFLRHLIRLHCARWDGLDRRQGHDHVLEQGQPLGPAYNGRGICSPKTACG